MTREFIARSTKMLRSIGRLSASALSHHGLSSAVFITNIAESDFRHTHVVRPSRDDCLPVEAVAQHANEKEANCNHAAIMF
jgi:hypothetical protein